MPQADKIQWFPFFPYRILHSDACEAMSMEEFGCYMLLLCKAWVRGKDASLPVEEQALAAYCHLPKVSSLVLSKFPIVETPWGQQRRNSVLYGFWIAATGKSEAATAAVNKRWDEQRKNKGLAAPNADLPPVPVTSVSEYAPNTPVLQRQVELEVELYKQEEYTQEEEKETTAAVVSDSGLQPGQPGYYEENQYPAGLKKPEKAIFGHLADAWEKILGEGAPPLRYPSKFPEDWEMLCRQKKSGDVIVPAFELWVVKEGQGFLKQNSFVLSAFMRVAARYMEQVKPLNELAKSPQSVVLSAQEQIEADPQLAAAMAEQAAQLRHGYGPATLAPPVDEEAEGEADIEFLLAQTEKSEQKS